MHLDINHSTFCSSMARFFVVNSCSYCLNPALPFFAATCQAVRSESSLANKNLLLISSGVSSSLAHSSSIPNTSGLHFSVAMCQAVLPHVSLSNKNLLFNSSGVSWSLAYSRNLTKASYVATSCCQVPRGVSVFIFG